MSPTIISLRAGFELFKTRSYICEQIWVHILNRKDTPLLVISVYPACAGA